jgi:hypothetical protein
VIGIAGGVELAVDGGERDAEQVGIGLAELWDIIGSLAAACLRQTPMQLGEEVFDGSKRRDAARSRYTHCAACLVHFAPDVRSATVGGTLTNNHAMSKGGLRWSSNEVNWGRCVPKLWAHFCNIFAQTHVLAR